MKINPELQWSLETFLLISQNRRNQLRQEEASTLLAYFPKHKWNRRPIGADSSDFAPTVGAAAAFASAAVAVRSFPPARGARGDGLAESGSRSAAEWLSQLGEAARNQDFMAEKKSALVLLFLMRSSRFMVDSKSSLTQVRRYIQIFWRVASSYSRSSRLVPLRAMLIAG